MPRERLRLFLDLAAGIALAAALSGCRSPAGHRQAADRTAQDIIRQSRESLGFEGDVSVDPAADTLRARLIKGQGLPTAPAPPRGAAAESPPPHWPDPAYLAARKGAVADGAGAVAVSDDVRIGLFTALEIAAGHSREFLARKETLFKTALALDVARNIYRFTLTAKGEGGGGGERTDGESTSKATGSAVAELKKSFQRGGSIATRAGLDLVEFLSGDGSSSQGLSADATLSLPLLRGSGRHIVSEPLVQAERNVVYALYEFERYRQEFVVRVASEYFDVLNRQEQVLTAAENVERVHASLERARRLADAGRIPEIQVDQAGQSELRARESWIGAVESAKRALDSFKLTLGLPADARVSLDPAEMEALTQALPAGETDTPRSAWEVDEEQAVPMALERRMDLRVALARVEDAERAVAVSADGLRGELTLLGESKVQTTRTSAGGDETSSSRSRQGLYSALLSIDLPIERTAERQAYRESLIGMEKALRDAEGIEDGVKSEVRAALRNLARARESIDIQRRAVALAQRRERSINLFLQAGRAEIRDLLEAQEDLVSAQDALTAALVRLRVAELETQRDLGVIEVDRSGVWRRKNEG
jgi:outer membrane protein TolC